MRRRSRQDADKNRRKVTRTAIVIEESKPMKMQVACCKLPVRRPRRRWTGTYNHREYDSESSYLITNRIELHLFWSESQFDTVTGVTHPVNLMFEKM